MKTKNTCSDCGVLNCYRQDKMFPSFCLTEGADRQVVDKISRRYRGKNPDALIARAAAEVEGTYYGKLTRVEEIIAFANRIGAETHRHRYVHRAHPRDAGLRQSPQGARPGPLHRALQSRVGGQDRDRHSRRVEGQERLLRSRSATRSCKRSCSTNRRPISMSSSVCASDTIPCLSNIPMRR